MAKDTDTKDYIDITQVKPGLKRELAFAIKSNLENESSIGTKRITRSRSGSMDSGVLKEQNNASNKRIKVSSTKSAKGCVNLLMNDGKNGGDEVMKDDMLMGEEPQSDGEKVQRCKDKKRTEQIGGRKSRKIGVQELRRPTRVGELLEMGFLEGEEVYYRKKKGDPRLAPPGVVRKNGILCFCRDCYGDKIVTANDFEIHSQSGNKRPADYIYLKNGKNLRDVMNACEKVPLESLEEVIKSFRSTEEEIGLCHSSASTVETKETCVSLASVCVENKPQFKPKSKLEKKKRSKKRSSSKTSKSEVASSSKPKGKLTKKDINFHKRIFQDVPDGTELGYFVLGERRKGGIKTGSGILCDCCKEVFSVSQFESHAGMASRRKPYLNIYTLDGVSLHELAVTVSKTLRKVTEKERDNLCSVCANRGKLVSCDMCPRAFHTACAKLRGIPDAAWYCDKCITMMQREKFVETNANAIAAGRKAGIDPLEEITKRCFRILGTLEVDAGGCVLCRSHDFSSTGFGPKTVIYCDQCEREYHVGCLKRYEIDDLQELPDENWFCGENCNNIHSALVNLVAHGDNRLEESRVNIVKTKSQQKGFEVADDLDLSWRLLRGRRVPDANEEPEMLRKAVDIFLEQFDPIEDPISGADNLIPHMVLGKKLRNRDFGGMYCAVLKVNSNIVSAGTIRVFGKEIAELPLVATSAGNKGQGYFQVLFSCIENLLISLGVKKLVLPAANDVLDFWTTKFGFEMILKEELVEYQKDYQMMVFEGTQMLQKSVVSA